MDDVQPLTPDRRPSLRFSPDRRLTALAALGVLIAVGLVAVSNDASGRLIFALAAGVLVAYVASDLIFTPRLAVDADGVRVRSPFVRAELGWDELERVHADARSHYGLRSVSLEIDAGETLIVLSKRALGADPDIVARAVEAFDPRGREVSGQDD